MSEEQRRGLAWGKTVEYSGYDFFDSSVSSLLLQSRELKEELMDRWDFYTSAGEWRSGVSWRGDLLTCAKIRVMVVSPSPNCSGSAVLTDSGQVCILTHRGSGETDAQLY